MRHVSFGIISILIVASLFSIPNSYLAEGYVISCKIGSVSYLLSGEEVYYSDQDIRFSLSKFSDPLLQSQYDIQKNIQIDVFNSTDHLVNSKNITRDLVNSGSFSYSPILKPDEYLLVFSDVETINNDSPDFCSILFEVSKHNSTEQVFYDWGLVIGGFALGIILSVVVRPVDGLFKILILLIPVIASIIINEIWKAL